MSLSQCIEKVRSIIRSLMIQRNNSHKMRDKFNKIFSRSLVMHVIYTYKGKKQGLDRTTDSEFSIFCFVPS